MDGDAPVNRADDGWNLIVKNLDINELEWN